MKKILLNIIFWLALLPFSKTQSLDSLIVKAIDENLGLKTLALEYQAVLEKVPQISLRPDPEIGIGIYPLPVETRLGAQWTRVSATQMLPWFGSFDSEKDLALAKAKPLYERISARRLEVEYQIKQAYFQLYQLEKSQLVIQQNMPFLESLERLALTKVESGKGSIAHVLRVQLKKEALQQELKLLEIQKAKPTTHINQYLNRPLGTEITTTDSLSFAVLPWQKDSLLKLIEDNHPALQMLELQQAIAQQAIELNELQGKPSFGVGLDYMLIDKRNDAEPKGNGRDIVQVRASVKIPLYKEQYEAKEREEKLKIAALENKKADQLYQFSAMIEKAFIDYDLAQTKMELYRSQQVILKATIPILETNYSIQGNQFDDLLEIEKQLIDYDLKILKAIIASHLAKSQIERFLVKTAY